MCWMIAQRCRVSSGSSNTWTAISNGSEAITFAFQDYYRTTLLAEETDPHLRGPEQLEWLARLAADRENMVAALRHLCDTGDARHALRMVVSLGWFWLLTGSQEEATTAFRLAAAGAPEAGGGPKRRKLSKAARKRISAAQKKRWAEKRKATSKG